MLTAASAYVAPVASQFFALMRKKFSCMVACEARHPSWFGSKVTAMLQSYAITRVQADPPQGQSEDFVPTTPGSYLLTIPKG